MSLTTPEDTALWEIAICAQYEITTDQFRRTEHYEIFRRLHRRAWQKRNASLTEKQYRKTEKFPRGRPRTNDTSERDNEYLERLANWRRGAKDPLFDGYLER